MWAIRLASCWSLKTCSNPSGIRERPRPVSDWMFARRICRCCPFKSINVTLLAPSLVIMPASWVPSFVARAYTLNRSSTA